MTLKRRPLTIVEIDLPYCERTYGQGLCGASLTATTVRENLFLHSQAFDNAYWTKSNTSVTGGYAAPDGTLTAFRVFDNAVNTTHRVARSPVSVTSGLTYELSSFVKAGTFTTVAMQIGVGGAAFPTGANHRATFDLSAGTVTAQGSSLTAATITADLNGWYRISISAVAASTTTDTMNPVYLVNGGGLFSFIGTGTDYVLAWGAQFEAGAGASNYKATTTATVSGLWGGGVAKCFNSRFTCQYASAYEAGTKTLTFAENQAGIPDMAGIFPALKGVSSRPGELNLSGIDPKSTALGKRARVTVNLQDFTNNDTWLDKYQSERVSGAALASGIGYNPLTRGRFLARTWARFPYYLGLPVRVRRGYVGDTVATMPTENYVMAEMSGPDAAGNWQCTAKDLFDLAENEKAVYPKASLGKLLADLDEDATTATLTPEGVGDDDYPSSGLARIGREIVSFTRTADVLTLTRGREGTDPQTHSALDVVQICGVLDGLTFNQAIETILKYEETAFDAFIPTADWQTENDTWLSGTTIGRVLVTKPTGKALLVGEICQLGVMVWWDAVDQEIKYKVNAPILPDETYYAVSDEASLLAGSPDIDRAEDQRASAIWVYHGIKDWTDDTLAARNFTKLMISVPAENLYGQEAYKEIFTRWFGRTGDDVTASIIGERLLARFLDVPRVVSGTLDVKDRAGVKLGERITVESYVLQDIDGATLAVPMQVNYAEYTGDDRVKFRAEEYRIDGRFGFWMDDGTAPADYDSATEAQKNTGAFWGDDTQTDFGDGRGFMVWF